MSAADDDCRAIPCGDCWVLVDPEDAETLDGLFLEGWRLKLVTDRRRHSLTPTLVLGRLATVGLARAIMQATESQLVTHRGPSGPLDCRKSQMELRDAGRRIGWASKINGSGPGATAHA